MLLTRLRYAPNSGLSAKDMEETVARADIELRAFYLKLPSHLRMPPTLHPPIPAHIYQLQQVQMSTHKGTETNLGTQHAVSC